MKTKYFGKIEDFKSLVVSVMISGDWDDQGDKWVFRSYSGGILNWWPLSGTVQFQGKEPGRSELQQALHEDLQHTAQHGRPVQPTGGPTRTHVAASSIFSESPIMPLQGQGNVVAPKTELAPLLRDLADHFADQGLILMVVNGVPRIVKEHEYDHYAAMSALTKSPAHITRAFISNIPKFKN